MPAPAAKSVAAKRAQRADRPGAAQRADHASPVSTGQPAVQQAPEPAGQAPAEAPLQAGAAGMPPGPALQVAPATMGMPLQAKVSVGAPDDPMEQEADAAATAVLDGGPRPRLSPVGADAPPPASLQAPAIGMAQLACPDCSAAQGPVMAARAGAVQAMDAGTEAPQAAAAEPIQAAADAPMQAAGATVAQAIRDRSPGRPMHGGTRAALEDGLGADLGDVRVHDTASDRRNSASLGARAFTQGDHIWMGPGERETDLGLMAHESAHVLQQRGGDAGRSGGQGAAARGAAEESPPAMAPEDRAAAGAGGAAAAGAAGGAGASASAGAGAGAAAGPAEAGAGPAAGASAGAAVGSATAGGPTGRAAAGAGAEGGATGPAGPGGQVGGGAGGGAGAELLMPEPRAGLSASDRERLADAQDAAAANAEAYQSMPPAEEGVAEAQGAVTIPEEETEARAEAALAAELDARPEPSAGIEDLCERILAVIHSRQPPDEASLVESEPAEEAEAAGSVLEGSVESDAERVEGDYAALQEEQPAAAPPEPGAIEPEPESVEAPPIDAAAAAPEPIDTEGALDADVEANAERIREAGMESEPAQEAARTGHGPIADAMAAQDELAETAARDPAEVMAEQAAARESAAADMAALQARAVSALQTERSGTVGGVGGQQQEMVGSEEQMRASISAAAQRIYDAAAEQVSGLLEPLPDLAMRRWQTGVQVLSTRFDNDLAEVQRWLDERYSGVSGALTELADDVFGKPAWVTRAYNRAEEHFAEGVCDLIREISTEVNGIIATCERIVADANADIAELFGNLPEELREWAAGEQARMQGQLDALGERARSTRDELNQNLSREVASTVQQARERVHELREAAKGLVQRAADAIAEFAEDPARFIIEGLLELVGIPPASFWALLNRIGEVINDIADDPIGFANNLVAAIGQGFQRFFDAFGEHVVGGFFDWLFSGLGAVGVTIPSDFSLQSIITFALELMGITWARIREILARHIGEENVALLEQAYELIATLMEQGVDGIFEMIKDALDPRAILDQIIQAAVDYLIEALIRAVTPRIIALFNPAGAIVQAIEVIYRVLAWIFEHAARIFSLVETVVNGAADLIAGNIGGMATAVEGALARLIAPVIDFLAGFLGLGNLPDHIADTIRGFQEMVLNAIDRIIGWLAERARGLLRALGIGGADDEEEAGSEDEGDRLTDQDVGEVVRFSAGGESHRLWVEVRGDTADVYVASDRERVDYKLAETRRQLDLFPPDRRDEIQSALQSASQKEGDVTDKAEQANREISEALLGEATSSDIDEARRADEQTEAAEHSLAQDMAVVLDVTPAEHDFRARAIGLKDAVVTQTNAHPIAAQALVVAVGISDKGNKFATLNSGVARAMETALRSNLYSDETFAGRFGGDLHAEDNLRQGASSRGESIVHLDASNPICLDCQRQVIEALGIATRTEFTGRRPSARVRREQAELEQQNISPSLFDWVARNQ